MKQNILVIAISLSEIYLRQIKALAKFYNIHLVVQRTSPVSGVAVRMSLARFNVKFTEDGLSCAALRAVLKSKAKFYCAVICAPGFVRVTSIAEMVRQIQPACNVALFTDRPPFFYEVGRAQELHSSGLFGHIEELKVRRAADYSSCDIIVVPDARSKRELETEIESVPIRVFDAENAEGVLTIPGRVRPLSGIVASIIVPCFNHLTYTKKCVNSVLKNTYRPYELIIVDNGSTDGSRAYLKGLEGAKVISNRKNAGFAKSINQGIRASKGGYIVVLNNDTIVTPGWLEGLVRCAKASRSIGLVGPKTNNAPGIQKVDGVMHGIGSGLEKWSRVFAAANSGNRSDAMWLTGFCLLIKRAVIEKAGYFDERFNIGTFEDYDYCIRARAAGFRLYCAEDVYVHHFGSRTFTRADYAAQIDKNRKIFIKKWGIEYYDLLMYAS